MGERRQPPAPPIRSLCAAAIVWSRVDLPQDEHPTRIRVGDVRAAGSCMASRLPSVIAATVKRAVPSGPSGTVSPTFSR